MTKISNIKYQISKLQRIGYWKLDIGNFCRKQAGFTLVEMVVTIAVIAILAALVLTIVNPFVQFQKANDARRKSDLAELQKSLEQYYQDFGKYPAVSGYQIVGLNGTPVPWGSKWQPYMNVMPKDPSSSRSYVYNAASDRQTYWLYASLERTSDPQACNKGNICVNANALGNVCGASATCNFGLSSPNTIP